MQKITNQDYTGLIKVFRIRQGTDYRGMTVIKIKKATFNIIPSNSL